MTDKPEQREIKLKTIRGSRVFIAPNDIPAIRDNAGVYLVVHAARDIVADLINQHIGLEQEAESQRIRAEAAEQELDIVRNREQSAKDDAEVFAKEMHKQRRRANAAEQERDKLLQALRNIVAVPVAKSMHNEALVLHNIAHKALEGSQPDGE
ncbi:hypothetical protein [Paenibacillus shenyangensis]|uniref:hypothetical protein n=1 Tax=Paenibacillus sp. A9 TaxID=1284352 RepID=UPI00035EABA2|nr:hypothetical protein [Paenibacillus sp. A9]